MKLDIYEKYLEYNYKVNFFDEFKRKWVVFGVLVALLAAVISPRIGSYGGLFHTEYTSYIPLIYIYFSAGLLTDVGSLKTACKDFRFQICVQSHVFVVTPVLVAFLTQFFGLLGTDERILKGALLSSCGSTNIWLSVGLQVDSEMLPHVVTSAVIANVLSVVVTPVALFIICGNTSTHPLEKLVWPSISALVPFSAGILLKGHVRRYRCQEIIVRLSVVLLVYVECCVELERAEGQLHALDVLLTFGLVCLWLALSACVSYLMCGRVCPERASQAVLCSVHKSFYMGWNTSTSCSTAGLSRLPAVLAAPAQPAMLAALYAHTNTQTDK